MARAVRHRRKRSTKPAQPIGAALDGLARQLGISRRLKEYTVLAEWKALVGEQIAKATVPERIDNGTLYVRTTSAPWRTELVMKRFELIRKINGQLGKDIVKDIRFR